MMSVAPFARFFSNANFSINVQEVNSYIQSEIRRDLSTGSKKAFCGDKGGSYVLENFGNKDKKFYIKGIDLNGNLIY